MHLFALAITICNLTTGDCQNYAASLYKSRADCEIDAADMRKERIPGVVLIYCAPTTPKEHRRHATHS